MPWSFYWKWRKRCPLYTGLYEEKPPGISVDSNLQERRPGKLEAIIFRETTTIGIRYVEMVRTILPRRTEKRQTSYGEVAVKICEGEGEVRITPEYESIREVCRERGLPFQKVYDDVLQELK